MAGESRFVSDAQAEEVECKKRDEITFKGGPWWVSEEWLELREWVRQELAGEEEEVMLQQLLALDQWGTAAAAREEGGEGQGSVGGTADGETKPAAAAGEEGSCGAGGEAGDGEAGCKEEKEEL